MSAVWWDCFVYSYLLLFIWWSVNCLKMMAYLNLYYHKLDLCIKIWGTTISRFCNSIVTFWWYFFLPLDKSFCRLLRGEISLYMSGFHGNTNCLTAALQGLFSALWHLCAKVVWEGESMTLLTQGSSTTFLFFHSIKSW